VVDKVVLVEAVLEDLVLFGLPFEVTAGGPAGEVGFGMPTTVAYSSFSG